MQRSAQRLPSVGRRLHGALFQSAAALVLYMYIFPDGACSAPMCIPQPTSPPPAYVLLITSTMHRTCSAAEQHCGLLQHDVNREAPTSRPCFSARELTAPSCSSPWGQRPGRRPCSREGQRFASGAIPARGVGEAGGRGNGNGSGTLTGGPDSCSRRWRSTSHLCAPATRRQSERCGASARGARARALAACTGEALQGDGVASGGSAQLASA